MNVVGTRTLLDAARRNSVGRPARVHRRGVRVESMRVLARNTPAAELPYAASKASSDLFACILPNATISMVITNAARTTTGLYQFPEKVIPLFVTNLIDGLTVPLWRRRPEHPRLAARQRPLSRHRACLTGGRSGEIYNIGGGTELTNKELTGKLLEACGADWDSVRPVEDRKGHDRRYSVSIDKIREELGYEPEMPFEVGPPTPLIGTRTTRAWCRAHKGESVTSL